jgi:hypothetical protein
MKKLKLIILLSFISIIFTKENKFVLAEDNLNLKFSLGELQISTKNSFSNIKSEGYGTISLNGVPDLPIYSTMYQLTPGKQINVNYTVTESHVLENIHLKSFNMNKELNQNIRFESSNNFPNENLLLTSPQVMRDMQFVKISLIPFIYNSNTQTLEIFDEVEFEITEIDDPNFNNNLISAPSQIFDNLYKDLIPNYSSREMDEYQDPAILYICGGSSENNSDFQDLVEWRKQRGFTVYTTSTSSIGTSTTAIKNYIQNAYQNFDPAPEYVALVGDVGGSYSIPTFEGDNYGFGHNTYGNACEGDHPYSQLNGNDLYPEVLIGRMSVRTTSDLSTVVSKIITYEKATYMDFMQNYYETASLVGDPSTSGNSCAITNEYIAELLENHGVDDVRLKTSGGSYNSWMRNNLADGVLYFNYRGYLGVSGFTSSDIDNASNGFMLPFASVLTCGTGSFSEDNASLTESFFRAGTPANPKGAVASIGTATWNTHTLFNNIVDMGIYDGLFAKKLGTAGAAVANGKLALDMTYPGNPDNWISAFTHWNNLIGDPSTHLWTTTPKLFSVSHLESLSFGTNYIEVLVLGNDGNPLNNSRVTLYKSDEVFSNTFTNENGIALIPMNYTTSGDISLVVTNQGYKPYISNINIENPTGNGVVNLDPSGVIIINDDGNNNNLTNPGETITLTLPIMNFGSNDISDLTISLSSNSEKVTLVNSTITVGSLGAGATTEISGLSFTLNSSAKHNEDLELMVHLTDGSNQWDSQLNIEVHGFDFNFVSYMSADASPINPGETQGINITLSNIGSISSGNISGTLSTDNTEIDVTNSTVNWNSINAGGLLESSSPFLLDISNTVLNGTEAPFKLTLESENGYSNEINFNISIGRITDTDPTGTDEYGYFIYDSNDDLFDLSPTYDWIEINQTGQNLNLNDNGNGTWSGNGPIAHVNLPFQFSYYGINYNEITVCTNGWISFGSSESEAFRNYEIPGAGGPPAMVAVFWDDLKTNSGNVYTFADPNNEYFVVEWSNMKTYDQNSTENFQIILYNNSVMPYGDGEMKLQYKTFNNTSNGNFSSYPPVHGSFCTIGIENELTDIGLQYTYNNQYSEGSSQLENETAIFITTQSPIPLPIPVMTYFYDDMNFSLNLGEYSSSSMTISNTGEEQSILSYSVTKMGVSPFEVIGGIDSYGHVWSDSNIDNVIEYEWIDIDGIGTQLTFPNNDVADLPINIGFDFLFYGESYSQCIVNPNGWVGFGDDNTAFSNLNLPSISAPKPAIFGFWDDLNPISTDPAGCPEGIGNVFYHSFEDKLVIWFDHVSRCSSTPEYSGNFDFQFVLHQNGEIDLNYREMTGNLTSSTIGLQNDSGTDAVAVVYDGDYAQSQKSLKFKTVDDVNWLVLEGELNGELSVGESTTIDIIAESSDLPIGDYSAELLLSSSIQSTITIPVTMSLMDNMLLGDINFDEQINVTDIVLLVSYILGDTTFDDSQLWTADVNSDSNINVVDIVQLVAIILN